MANKKPTPKTTQVTHIKSLSDTVKRIYLSSTDNSLCETKNLGCYVKFLFHPDGGTDISLLQKPQKPIMRTYTISEVTDSEIAVDFVMHASTSPTPNNGGYGSHWAATTSVGDNIQIAGPGASSVPNFECNKTLLVADLTSLPALAHAAVSLPIHVTGNLLIVNEDISFKPTITLPVGIVITEFLSYQALENFMHNDFQWTTEKHSVWCACEYTMMRAIRRLCSEHLLLEKECCYFSSYWKRGMTEDGHKIIKQKDSIQNSL